MALSLDEIDRYQRQILLPEWGAIGQERLRSASVRVGGGGVAAGAAVRYLAGAGVGRLRVDSPALVVAARGLNPLIEVVLAVGPRIPQVPGQPEPDPAEPTDPEHPDEAGPDRPEPEQPLPEQPSIHALSIDVADVDDVAGVRLASAEDRVAIGAALAVEAIKAILGLPYRSRVQLQSPPSPRPPAGAPVAAAASGSNGG